MSYFHVKALLGVLFVAAGLAAALSMLTLMGKAEKKMGTGSLKSTHRVAGWLFVALLAALAAMGLHYLAAAGDTLPLRGVLHWTLGALLVFLVLLKLVVVKAFKQFLKLVPVMGMMLVVLALLVATLSLVFFLISGPGRAEFRTAVEEVAEHAGSTAFVEPHEDHVETQAVKKTAEQAGEPVEEPVEEPVGRPTTEEPPAETVNAEIVAAAPEPVPPAGNAVAGADLYRTNCLACHHADSENRKIGPGLAGRFGRNALGSREGPVTREAVRELMLDPPGTMPSFEGFLSEVELDDLVAYLETL